MTADMGLEVQDLTIRFGGLVAVEDVSLRAALGRVTALIGPNGAGKTTLFNACSGQQRPTSGRILLGGTDITDLSPAHRAQRGIGRTFQRVQLFDSLSVAQNLAMGREAGLAGTKAIRHLLPRSGDRGQIRAAVDRVSALCNVAHLLDRQAGELSTGERRLVELARVLAGQFSLLLLDEPSSGLDGGETVHFAGILRRVVSEWGVGIFLVEHDMELVMSISEYVYVLDFGKLLFQGSPDEVRNSAAVRSAYLGVGV